MSRVIAAILNPRANPNQSRPASPIAPTRSRVIAVIPNLFTFKIHVFGCIIK